MLVTFTKRTPPGAALYEAAGLSWLADAPDGVPVVQVVEASEREIVLERLRAAAPTRASAADFGRRLATTHDAGAPAFGAPPAGWQGASWIGAEPMTLEPSPTWGGFYAEQRCLPYARRAFDRGGLDPDAMTVVEKACTRIAAGLYDDDAPPARIHGDLWSGNVLWSPAGVVLIDPAAHGGHGLTDIAMLDLFGCPGVDRITAAWAEAAGVPHGWHDLVGLHQLHPLAVHAVSHGPAYAAQLVSVARRYA